MFNIICCKVVNQHLFMELLKRKLNSQQQLTNMLFHEYMLSKYTSIPNVGLDPSWGDGCWQMFAYLRCCSSSLIPLNPVWQTGHTEIQKFVTRIHNIYTYFMQMQIWIQFNHTFLYSSPTNRWTSLLHITSNWISKFCHFIGKEMSRIKSVSWN